MIGTTRPTKLKTTSSSADPEAATQLAARGRVEGRERLQIEPQRDHLEAIATRDAEPDQVVDGRLADADQASLRRPSPPRATGTARLSRTEVALEHVPVVGVDDDGPRPHGGERRQPREKSGLRHVGMHHVGAKATGDGDDPRQGGGVVRGEGPG